MHDYYIIFDIISLCRYYTINIIIISYWYEEYFVNLAYTSMILALLRYTDIVSRKCEEQAS